MESAAATQGDQTAVATAIRIGAEDLVVWPDAQPIATMAAPLMAQTDFADWERYHEGLIDAALTAERDPRFRGAFYRSNCGTKVRALPQWGSPAATLVHGRALCFGHRMLSRRPVFADD